MHKLRSINLILCLATALALPLALPVAQAAPGDLDTTFGTGGKVTTDFSGGTDQAFAVALQTDGKIVVAGEAKTGYSREDFALARYHPNGTLDTTFGTGGKVTTDFAGDTDQVFAVALQPDGKIVVAGEAKAGYSGEDFALARYNNNRFPVVTLKATLDTTGGNIHLEWSGGAPPYTLRRAEDPKFQVDPTTLLDHQPATSDDDPVLNDGKTYFYLVELD